MRWRKKNPQERHALIFKDHVIRYVRSQGPALKAAVFADEYRLPEGLIQQGSIVDVEQLGQVLHTCAKQWGLQRKQVQFCIPDAHVLVRTIEVPATVPEEELKGHCYYELGQSIHLPLEVPVLDCWRVKKTAETQEVVMYAAEENVVQSFVKLLGDAKMQATVADVSTLCAYRSFISLASIDPQAHYVLLQVDESAVTMTIYYDHVPMFYRHSPRAPDAPFGFVEELGRLMHFYEFTMNQGAAAVEAVGLTGDDPNLSIVEETLRAELVVPIETLGNAVWPPIMGETFYDALGLTLRKTVIFS
ncbi:type IV pilus biogenesis protein PilM [Aureibacillus halotolerans]|uniref:Type IV pilus assembly protein PilM n=1 Tax=Aureibacillus halotolerans TaxID=1508390 RepID=A0A4R6U5H6_9BACI|nr:pilus assembly protein PilM [Aureibacillus halotolerans]TDQ38284.1 type IV pilus assembly protein PilM [Aureibacillus halotolerans]